MGIAIEVLSGYVTGAAGTAMDPLTMLAGNSLTIRNGAPDQEIYIVAAWALNQANGSVVRIRSPRLHDNVEGMTFRVPATGVRQLFPLGMLEKVIPQDTLVVEMMDSGAAADLDYVCLLIYYKDLPGVDGRFITAEDLKKRARSIIGVRNTLTLDTDGTYDGEEAINAEFDLMRANEDYAILGTLVDTNVPCVRYRGTDTGNLGVGVPGISQTMGQTGRWFVYLSELTGLPTIPVINSANRANVLIDAPATENDITLNISTIMAELSPGG